jgi:hypothetical protein
VWASSPAHWCTLAGFSCSPGAAPRHDRLRLLFSLSTHHEKWVPHPRRAFVLAPRVGSRSPANEVRWADESSEAARKQKPTPRRHPRLRQEILPRSRLKRTNPNRLLKASSFLPISASNALWPIRMAHSAVCLPSNALRGHYPKAKISAPTKTAGCIILHTREGNLAIPAASNPKRPRTLPNRSREDRIRG